MKISRKATLLFKIDFSMRCNFCVIFLIFMMTYSTAMSAPSYGDVAGAESGNLSLGKNLMLNPLSQDQTDTNYITVLFLTNRKFDAQAFAKARSNDGLRRIEASYTNQPDVPLRAGLVTVAYPSSRKRGEHNLLVSGPNPNVGTGLQVVHFDPIDTPQEFERSAETKLAASRTGRVLLYVHGFRTSFANSIVSAALLSLDVGQSSLPIVFSWPSDPDGFIAYQYYRATQTMLNSISYMSVALGEVSHISHAAYSLLAHSMGSALTVDALRFRDDPQSNQFGPPIELHSTPNSIVLAAPDIDKARFGLYYLPSMISHKEKITAYCSTDFALASGYIFDGSTRLGFCLSDPDDLPGARMVAVRGGMDDALRHFYITASPRIMDDVQGSLSDDPDDTVGTTSTKRIIREIELP